MRTRRTGVLLLTVVAVVVASCGGDGAAATTSAPTTTATTAAPTASTAPATSAAATTTEAVPVDPLTGGIAGVAVYADLSQDHVDGDVTYDPRPPVGGAHAARWVACGFYSDPVPEEGAVHSMEHGAVWVTYDPAVLSDEDVTALAGLADATFGADPRAAFVLVSPYPDMPSPIVASAWGVQLVLDGIDDPRLIAFLEHFANGPQNPEPGAPC